MITIQKFQKLKDGGRRLYGRNFLADLARKSSFSRQTIYKVFSGKNSCQQTCDNIYDLGLEMIECAVMRRRIETEQREQRETLLYANLNSQTQVFAMGR